MVTQRMTCEQTHIDKHNHILDTDWNGKVSAQLKLTESVANKDVTSRKKGKRGQWERNPTRWVNQPTASPHPSLRPERKTRPLAERLNQVRKPASDNRPTASGNDNDGPNDNDEREGGRKGGGEEEEGETKNMHHIQNAQEEAVKHRLTKYERLNQQKSSNEQSCQALNSDMHV